MSAPPGRVWKWRLSAEPLSSADRTDLAPDLEQLGADESLLDVYQTTIAVRSRLTRARWIRADQDGRLVGVALIIDCRDSGVSFFGPRARINRLLRLGPPVWYWDRTQLGADGISLPGLVVAGVDREAFAAAAVRRLAGRRPVGSVISTDAILGAPSSAGPFVGSCRVDLADGVDPRTRLLAAHRNLARKLRRFTGRGGTIDTLTGPMPPAVRPDLLAGYAIERPINPPFAEFYPSLVQAHWNIDSPRLVHLLARIDDELVGYHTLWHTGSHLAMLSGAVGRPAGGSVHAYENLMVASLELARDLGCRSADFGLAVNAAKREMLGRSANHLHLVSPVPPVRAGLSLLRSRSRLAPAHLAEVTGASVEPSPTDGARWGPSRTAGPGPEPVRSPDPG